MGCCHSQPDAPRMFLPERYLGRQHPTDPVPFSAWVHSARVVSPPSPSQTLNPAPSGLPELWSTQPSPAVSGLSAPGQPFTSQTSPAQKPPISRQSGLKKIQADPERWERTGGGQRWALRLLLISSSLLSVVPAPRPTLASSAAPVFPRDGLPVLNNHETRDLVLEHPSVRLSVPPGRAELVRARAPCVTHTGVPGHGS